MIKRFFRLTVRRKVKSKSSQQCHIAVRHVVTESLWFRRAPLFAGLLCCHLCQCWGALIVSRTVVFDQEVTAAFSVNCWQLLTRAVVELTVSSVCSHGAGALVEVMSFFFFYNDLEKKKKVWGIFFNTRQPFSYLTKGKKLFDIWVQKASFRCSE